MMLLGNNDIHQETREGGGERERERETITTIALRPAEVISFNIIMCKMKSLFLSATQTNRLTFTSVKVASI